MRARNSGHRVAQPASWRSQEADLERMRDVGKPQANRRGATGRPALRRRQFVRSRRTASRRRGMKGKFVALQRGKAGADQCCQRPPQVARARRLRPRAHRARPRGRSLRSRSMARWCASVNSQCGSSRLRLPSARACTTRSQRCPGIPRPPAPRWRAAQQPPHRNGTAPGGGACRAARTPRPRAAGVGRHQRVIVVVHGAVAHRARVCLIRCCYGREARGVISICGVERVTPFHPVSCLPPYQAPSPSETGEHDDEARDSCSRPWRRRRRRRPAGRLRAGPMPERAGRAVLLAAGLERPPAQA